MSKSEIRSVLIFPILLLLGLAMGWAGSQGGVSVGKLPLFLGLVVLTFIIQWIVFVPAFRHQDETFFDLTGSLTYTGIMTLALLLNPERSARSFLVAALVMIWAARLGTFLYRRVHKAGKDGRFDELKPHFFRFLNVWTIQALWIIFTSAGALVVLTTTNQQPLGIFAWVGLLLWLIGFAVEVIADSQKSRFRAVSGNKDKFIQSGLWSRSRHPNYFGEIVLWIGIAIIALPVLQGWQWIALISPIFVTLLLTRVSGIPLLENRAEEKWGGQEEYETYREQTPVLIPRLSQTRSPSEKRL